MNKLLASTLVALCLALGLSTHAQGFYNPDEAYAPVPLSHIMICCRSANEDVIKFKVGDHWTAHHDYANYNDAYSILSQIKDAGINTVLIDLTNPSQWATVPGSWPNCSPNENALWDSHTKQQLASIDSACQQLGMQYAFFIGNLPHHSAKYWNEICKRIWEGWASKPVYRKYGFGDGRPLLVIFNPGNVVKETLAKAAPADKEYITMFRIGTCQVNDPVDWSETDGWGYRHMSSGSTNLVRFASPNEGVAPSQWKRSTLEQWKKKIAWAGQARQYCVFGSYDDTCDGIFWGIAETSQSKNAYKRYPSGEAPDAYYNAVRDYLRAKRGK